MKITKYLYYLLILCYILLINVNKTLATRKLIKTMLNRSIIGKKHTPEKKIINSKIAFLSKSESKKFEIEYASLIKEKYILRIKKRTKKGSDWHISLNPRKMSEIYEHIQGEL